MAYVHEVAVPRIWEWLHEVARDLVGSQVELTTGEIGVVRSVHLDTDYGIMMELHGAKGIRRPVALIRRKVDHVTNPAIPSQGSGSAPEMGDGSAVPQ